MTVLHRKWHVTHITTLLACSAIALSLPYFLELARPGLLEPVEFWTVDLRFGLRPPLPVSKDPSQAKSDTLVAIDYDDRAAREYGLGRWPWDRRVHAQVFDLLRKAGARTVMVDLLLDQASRDRAEDRALIEATRRAGIVFYPVVFNPVPESESTDTFRFAAPRHLLQAEVFGSGRIPAVGDLTLPLPGLIEAASGLGHIQRTIDRRGVLRRMPLVFTTRGGFVPALSFATALRLMDVDPATLRIERGRAIHFKTRRAEDVMIPIDAQGQAWINYAGAWGTRFTHYPYSWLLDQMQSPDRKAPLLAQFKDRSVVLSNLTTGSGDRVATPFEHDFPTSEVHLHLLNMLLNRQFLRDATPGQAAMCLGLPLLPLTAAALSGGPAVILTTFAVVLGAYLVVLQAAFDSAGVILPAVNPLLALTVGLVLLIAARFLIVDRERMRFQSVLGACLPPQTIRVIRESPERIPTMLAGHTRELTVLFADIQGFSVFCKRAEPLQIQRVLRDYLTAMTVIIREYGGTLDKYMGDGIMAFFGDAEPEEGGADEEEKRVERQAANAVRAGLAMQKKMAGLNIQWVNQGLEQHQIRIGINTGVVTVGNLGTDYLWDYTVIGQEVNKAQRLESAADPGGLLLSGRTYALARKQEALPADLPPKVIALKGIGEETDIHAVPPELVPVLSVSAPDFSAIA